MTHDLVSSFSDSMMKKFSGSQQKTRKRRATKEEVLGLNDLDSDNRVDADGQEIKSTITVETAVFVDETLYDIMKRTFPGMFLLPKLALAFGFVA